jgi:hypothetical protein
MSPTDIFAQPISFEALQLYKRLEPLAPEVMEDLRQVERLDVSGFTEAEDVDDRLAGSVATTNALIAALADQSARNTFQVPYRMLPDRARDLSDIYIGHALAYLMEMDRRGVATVQFEVR